MVTTRTRRGSLKNKKIKIKTKNSSAKGIIENMVKTNKEGLTYVAEYKGGQAIHKVPFYYLKNKK